MNIFSHEPVILVPGFYSTASAFDKLSNYLMELGWSVYILELVPNTGELELEYLAKQLADFISKTFPNQQLVNLVGFSMGGIVSRYYVQELGGIDRVQKLITVASPHYGTKAAYLCDRKACLQLRPDSKFLQDLNRHIFMLAQIGFTSIYNPLDFIILPPQSSLVPVGENVTVPVLHHAWTVTDEKIFQAISTALNKPLAQDKSQKNTSFSSKLS